MTNQITETQMEQTVSLKVLKDRIYDLRMKTILPSASNEERDKALNELLNIRGDLQNKFMPIINTIEEIEAHIKDMSLPKGVYGSGYTVKVTTATNSVVKEPRKVYEVIQSQGLEPLDYFKLKLSDPYVKALVTSFPDLVEKQEGSSRHSFQIKKG